MSLDELLHGDRLDALAAEDSQGVLQPGGILGAHRARCAGPAARLEDQREADLVGEREYLHGAARRGRGGGRYPRLAQRPASSTACPGTATPSGPTCPGWRRPPGRAPWPGYAPRSWPRSGPPTACPAPGGPAPSSPPRRLPPAPARNDAASPSAARPPPAPA